VLTSYHLKKYRDDFGQPLEMIPGITAGQYAPLSLDFQDKKLTKIADEAIYTVDQTAVSLGPHQKATVRFLFSDGVNRFSKVLEFDGYSYLVQCTVEALNEQSPMPVRIVWAPGLERKGSYKNPQELTASRGLLNTGEKVEHWESKKLKEFHKIGSTVRWAGVENNYFVGIFIPRNQAADTFMSQAGSAEEKSIHNVSVFLAAQKPEPVQISMFIGPKDYVLLKQLGMDLQQAVDFGFFGPIAKALFFALRYFFSFTKNYGWAIVLLTVLIKIIFTPFTQMSFASMKKMQQMQPEMKKIQERYAKMKNDDPRKQSMNAEIMQLHKRYGVNPLGGCLPMLLQMPVLFAFYSLLSNSIELRRAPFALWLQDLSRPDPYYVTPLLMGASMLWQQRMTPTTDPMQKNMMYIMPVMFTFMSFKLQSGLVLYWLLSNVLAMAHQYYFQRRQQKAA
ncbi:MAG TPA: membrane protein insertase YidC, partial [Acidobacteriota bacterium]|nr:membrane protein insertase YidC [Acidobacteriota bacterium]